MLPNQTHLCCKQFLYSSVILLGSNWVEYSECDNPLQFFSELLYGLNSILLICPENSELLWSKTCIKVLEDPGVESIHAV